MADKKTATYDTIIADLEQGRYAPAYCLMGEESYYIDRIADYIATHALTPDQRDFNQTIVYGADTTPSQVAQAAARYPMMSDRQVVIVREAQALKGDTAPLENYLAHPQPATVLVLCHKNGTLDRRKRLTVLLDKCGVIFESRRLRDADLPRFIADYLKRRHVAADPKAIEMIAAHIGADLLRLTSELDKTIIALPKDQLRITPDTVEKLIGISKDFNVFELRDALIAHDAYKANLIIRYFDQNPKTGGLFKSLPYLFSFFQTLMAASLCPDKANPEALAAYLGLRSPWQAKDYITALRTYNANKIYQIISMIRSVDARSKGIANPSTPPAELMKELIFFILN